MARHPASNFPHDGGGEVSLADFKGRKLVLYFYPKADTSGCTLEAKDFSRLAPAFSRAGTAILGRFGRSGAQAGQVHSQTRSFGPAGVGRNPEMLTAYGVWAKKSMWGRSYMGILRNTYLIGPDGRIAYIWEKVRVAGHAEEVLAAAKEL